MTDAEYATKYGKGKNRSKFQIVISVLKWIVLFAFSITVVIPWVKNQWYAVDGTLFKYGERLGGLSNGRNGCVLSKEDARLARLAHFERSMNEKKTD